MPRKSITDMIPDIDAPEPEPGAEVAVVSHTPEPPALPAASPPAAPNASAAAATAAPRPRRNRSASAAALKAGAPSRPSARDLAAPPRGQVAREALKADVPAELALLQRLHRYRIDTGTDIRDQVAIAVDEWLTSQGY
jgi:hypothetical protein